METRLVVHGKDSGGTFYFNIKANRLERDDSIMLAYDGDDLVAGFDLGSIDDFWLSERQKIEEI